MSIQNTGRQRTFVTGLLRSFAYGVAFTAGIAFTALLAQTATAWTNGETLTATKLNQVVTDLNTLTAVARASGGNLGVGTVSPAHKLEVSGVSNTYARITNTGADSTGGLQLLNDARAWLIQPDGSNGDALTIRDGTAAQNRLVVLANGNVGIGTGTPQARLHVGTTVDNCSFAGCKIYAATSGSNFVAVENTDNNAEGYFGVGTTTFVLGANGPATTMLFDITGSTRMSLTNTGALAVGGALSKGSGTFDIPHPDPARPKGTRLRHSFVESPTAGDNIYRFRVTISSDGGKTSVTLPAYWPHLNENPQVWVSPDEHFGRAYGQVQGNGKVLTVHADRKGSYHVMLIGTRKDQTALLHWNEKGLEYVLNRNDPAYAVYAAGR